MPPVAAQRSQELEESYRIWSGRIQALQKDHDQELDGERRFVLAARVAEAVRYRDEIARHLACLEQGAWPLQPLEPGSLLSEALAASARDLTITERSDYVLQGADVHLFLAQIALDAGDRVAALEHATQARQLATCDGPSDYTYMVVYDEAGALLDVLDHESAKSRSTKREHHEVRATGRSG